MGTVFAKSGGSRFNNRRVRTFKSPLDKAKAYEVVWQQVAGLFEAIRPFEDASFVYVVGEIDHGPLKIGLSKDPIARLRTMQTGNPRRLRIEYVLAGQMTLEKLLHELWEPFGIVSARSEGKPDATPGTEWFKPDARETLLPIIAAAADRQIALLTDESSGVTFLDMERVVREAHAESGFLAQGRDEIRLLAQGPGYVVRRRSRI